MTTTIEYYMNLPYTIELVPESEGGWFVAVKELRGCMSQGDTVEEAVEMIREAMQLWLEVALEENLPIPEPRPEEDFSGKFVVRVPRSLHRELVEEAERQGTSLNQYINVALARAIGRAPATSQQMSDQANWPGLSDAVRQALLQANLAQEAEALDEKLFVGEMTGLLAKAEKAIVGANLRSALAHLDTMAGFIRPAVRKSLVFQLLLDTLDLLADQVEGELVIEKLETALKSRIDERLQQSALVDYATRIVSIGYLEPNSSQTLQALGLLLSSQGDIGEAISLLRRHLEIDPGNPTSLKALSAALFREGRAEEALRLLDETWQQTQTEEAGVQLGRFLIQLNRLPHAEKTLSEVAKRLPSPRTYAEWGLALTLLQRHQEACQVLQQAIELDPNFDRAWRGLAHCYDRMGESAEAVKAADRALAIDKSHSRNWQARGDALLSQGQHAEALAAAQRGIELIDPEDKEARPVLFELLRQEVQALVGLQQFDQALAQLDTSRQRFPEEERFPLIQASLLAFLGRYGDIITFTDSLDPSLAENLTPYRYEALHAMGEPEKALALVSPQLQVGAERRAMRLERLADVGLTLYLKGQPAAARAVFEQLYHLDPRPRFASNLGFLLAGAGEMEAAAACFQDALEAPSGADWQLVVLSNRGYLHLIQGNLEQAEVDFARVAEQVRDREEEAILRVAYWRAGHVVPDYMTYPNRFLPIHLSVIANQVTLRLARGDLHNAEALVRQIITAEPHIPLGYALLGSIRLAEGDIAATRQAWQQAMEQTDDPKPKFRTLKTE